MPTIKAKEFCLSDFGAQKVFYTGNNVYDSMRGKQQTNIGYMHKGSCLFSTDFYSVECKAGDVIYIPEGTRYTSHSCGTPDVEYYCIHLTFRTDKEGTRFDRKFGMQKIEKLSNSDVAMLIPRIYELVEKGDAVSKMVAISEFYRLFSGIIPHLKEATSPDCSLPVQRAITFMESHFCDDYSTADLAKECFVSESRLYHLFREQLHTTPVAYKNELRILRSIEYVKSGYKTVEEISQELGFHSAAYFRRVFKEITGMTPMEYRKKYSLL